MFQFNILVMSSFLLIKKNLLSVSQFAFGNDGFIEFHPFHYFVKDIKTKVMPLEGGTHNGLYHFHPPAVKSSQMVVSGSSFV